MLVDEGFARFAQDRRADLVRISRATGGEQSLDDVRNEAWVMGVELAAARGCEPKFRDTEFQSLLLARLYQALFRYTEKNLRYAASLDQAPKGRDGEESLPLIERLAAENADPLMHWVNAEETRQEQPIINPHESTASAYVALLRSFGYSVAAVARYLRISDSMPTACWRSPGY